jgi:hypothetical protein
MYLLALLPKKFYQLFKETRLTLEGKNFEVLGAKDKVLDYTKIPWKKYNERLFTCKV